MTKAQRKASTAMLVGEIRWVMASVIVSHACLMFHIIHTPRRLLKWSQVLKYKGKERVRR